MTAWLRRNRWAFLVIVVAVAAISASVTYPAWSRKTAPQRPEQTVALGDYADVNGAQWRMSEVTIPPLDYPPLIPEDPPENSRLLAYVIDRERDGAPSGLPEGFRFCLTSMVDGPRRWTMAATTTQVVRFSIDENLSTFCDEDGPLLVAMYVPQDAVITSVDVLLQPGDAPPTDEPPENAPVYETFDESPVVLRFQTS
ncbi:hypothetical protein [Mycobacterium sp. 236(2023)]|uniref:hypothetical protein n=1 Tax=Mycobacterium sp. 236(2023) TaxID=3038163 RepID=UPI002415887A|nr:hypothetical protein [Mycobacterium sp. 236(2023)]MDG4663379.1 hypothetical protein [Mycobacterium sp. 236(2023)]